MSCVEKEDAARVSPTPVGAHPDRRCSTTARPGQDDRRGLAFTGWPSRERDEEILAREGSGQHPASYSFPARYT